MNEMHDVRRVVLVVMDGLRPDAISAFGLPTIGAVFQTGASTFSGRTVSPSVTAAAMTSLFTGVGPEGHGVNGSRFGLPWGTLQVTPLPMALCWRSRPRPPPGAGAGSAPFLAARSATRTVDMHVQRLRSKLGDHADWLETVRGSGCPRRVRGRRCRG
jgi:hypothetical protein